jgi:protein-L-isoaspartate O-methyltransferase
MADITLPAPPARVLDVGAGSGRDAAWLTSLGLEVVAVEPSVALRVRKVVPMAYPNEKAPAALWSSTDR